jgi:hypothetical protein
VLHSKVLSQKKTKTKNSPAPTKKMSSKRRRRGRRGKVKVVGRGGQEGIISANQPQGMGYRAS